MSLSQAIDAAVTYVRAHSEEMTRSQVEEFKQLAAKVYLLAFKHGVTGAIPQVPEMRPELEGPDPPLPPVQFISKLNLPGDWDTATTDDGPLPPFRLLSDNEIATVNERVFLVCASPRWFQDMEILRSLAEALPATSDVGKPTASGVSLDARALALFIEHPDWTKKKIAEQLGCAEKSLAPKRCPKLAAARVAYRASRNLPRGSKDTEGGMEAWEDD